MSKRALISVSDKRGIVSFAQGLIAHGYDIVSTGGTAKALREAGVDVTLVEVITGFPECFDGRVKTLHPMVHGGLLADRDKKDHLAQVKLLGIDLIDLVAVNLYPFQETVQHGAEDVIEQIDIGGPTMIRSAAKNYEHVTVITDPSDYEVVLNDLEAPASDSSLRFRLMIKAFEHTAHYDAMISNHMQHMYQKQEKQPLVLPSVTMTFDHRQALRYGENPQQSANYYVEPFSGEGRFEQLWGKPLSYNNINDLSAAVNLVQEFERPAVVAIKHASPCGVAIGMDIEQAYSKAYQTDPLSIFGGIVATNGTIDVATAKKMAEIFLEVIYAPEFDVEAIEILKKKKNVRLLVPCGSGTQMTYPCFTQTRGGVLVQEADQIDPAVNYHVVTDRMPTKRELEEMRFAMTVCAHAKSNAIVISKQQQCIGIGQGQVSRVFAVENAIRQAKLDLNESVLASDAFFPFVDALDIAVKAGVTAVVQPGGSVADPEIIAFANSHNVAMVFTNRRHFRHG